MCRQCTRSIFLDDVLIVPTDIKTQTRVISGNWIKAMIKYYIHKQLPRNRCLLSPAEYFLLPPGRLFYLPPHIVAARGKPDKEMTGKNNEATQTDKLIHFNNQFKLSVLEHKSIRLHCIMEVKDETLDS